MCIFHRVLHNRISSIRLGDWRSEHADRCTIVSRCACLPWFLQHSSAPADRCLFASFFHSASAGQPDEPPIAVVRHIVPPSSVRQAPGQAHAGTPRFLIILFFFLALANSHAEPGHTSLCSGPGAMLPRSPSIEFNSPMADVGGTGKGRSYVTPAKLTVRTSHPG